MARQDMADNSGSSGPNPLSIAERRCAMGFLARQGTAGRGEAGRGKAGNPATGGRKSPFN